MMKNCSLLEGFGRGGWGESVLKIMYSILVRIPFNSVYPVSLIISPNLFLFPVFDPYDG